MMKQILISTVVAISSTILAGTSAVQAESILLDNFEGDSQIALPGISNTMTDLNTVLGGSRALEINLESAGGKPYLFVSNGMLVWDNPIGTKSTGSVLWNGNGNGLGADFSKQSGINLEIFDLDLDAQLEFTLTDSNGKESSLSRVGLQKGTIESFLFADFTENTDFDYSNIESVLLSLSGPTAVDGAFKLIELPMVPIVPLPPSIEGVPEPNTMLGLLAIGSASLLTSRRQN